MKLIYWHGWGYDSTFFAPLLNILSDFEATCVNEGYFGSPYIPETVEGMAIGIGHSQGFSRLIQRFPNLVGYVGLNGYTQFMQSESFPNGTAKAVLGAMIQQFQRHPEKVLGAFYERCGYLPSLQADNRNDELLRKNLTILRSLSIKLPKAPVLAITSADDLIVPATLQQDCFPKVHIIEQANHSLIFEHTQQCAHLIQNFIQSLVV